jgi:hypothetical protein
VPGVATYWPWIESLVKAGNWIGTHNRKGNLSPVQGEARCRLVVKRPAPKPE